MSQPTPGDEQPSNAPGGSTPPNTSPVAPTVDGSGSTMAHDTTDLKERLKLAETSFEVVMSADEHFDQKANRILSAIAFLTAAAAAIFARALVSLTPAAPTGGAVQDGTLVPPESLWLVLPAIVPFSLFVVIVILGTLAYLIALGPSFNRAFHKSSPDEKLKSRLFFEKIIDVKREDWVNTVSKTPLESLHRAYLLDYLNESYYIGQKIRTKVMFMAIGSFMFRMALPLFIPLLTTFISTSPWAIGASWLIYAIVAFGSTALESRRAHQEGGPTAFYPYARTITIAIAIILIVIFTVVFTLYLAGQL